jgi:hypothetical protein
MLLKAAGVVVLASGIFLPNKDALTDHERKSAHPGYPDKKHVSKALHYEVLMFTD